MNITTLEIAGIESALKGMRNPMNSWDKGDTQNCSDYKDCSDCEIFYKCNKTIEGEFSKNDPPIIGKNDMKLATTLKKAGTEHAKYLRMIQVWADFNMPRYWWSEFDTYKIGTTANSCSTMHKLLNNENPITLDLFEYDEESIKETLQIIVDKLEQMRHQYRDKNDTYPKNKLLRQAKQLLPESFLQLRTVNLNYATISNIYHQRKNHRLKEEWIDTFCSWVETLPYSKELIIGDTNGTN